MFLGARNQRREKGTLKTQIINYRNIIISFIVYNFNDKIITEINIMSVILIRVYNRENTK